MNWDQANRRGIYSKEYAMGYTRKQMREDAKLYMPVKPISPDEVVKTKKGIIPDEVIAAFNEIIAQNYSGGLSKFKQKDVIKLIISKLRYTKDSVTLNATFDSRITSEIYDKSWLDVEDIYRAEGWKVEYDKPGYNESYDATFTFSKGKS